MIVCESCQDTRAAAARDGSRVPCPVCGTDEQRRELFRRRSNFPTLRLDDLDETEKGMVHEWRLRGFHELDCLRWIEGKRYEPSKDPEFLRELFEAGIFLPPEKAPEPTAETAALARILPEPATTPGVSAPIPVPGPVEVRNRHVDVLPESRTDISTEEAPPW